MTNDWEKAIEFVLRMEGEYTLDPNDPGGETKWGISRKSYPNVDIYNLTKDEAVEIYRRDFWQACKCDELGYPMDLLVFDTAVNQGTGLAKRLLQISIGVTVDGIIGNKTIAASHKTGRTHIKKFLAERLAAYTRLISNNPSLLIFAFNWSHRVLSLAEIVFDEPYNTEKEA